jgi:hypothetical protein
MIIKKIKTTPDVLSDLKTYPAIKTIDIPLYLIYS